MISISANVMLLASASFAFVAQAKVGSEEREVGNDLNELSRPSLNQKNSCEENSFYSFGDGEETKNGDFRSPELVLFPKMKKRLSIRDVDVVCQVSYLNGSVVASNEPITASDMKNSYVIDHTRFVETFPKRCTANTILNDTHAIEPSFVLIARGIEQMVKATASKDKILAAGFKSKYRTIIFVHGFEQSYRKTIWIRDTLDLLVMNDFVGHQNVIFMDWEAGSFGSFKQVAAQTSVMGSYLANFIMKLIELGADRSSLHLFGHSLGAHLAGFAGKRILPRIGRITGWDPAGPCFGKFFSNPTADRLAAYDAQQVDISHFDSFFLGLVDRIGHADVYFNGGSSQPGCDNNANAMVKAIFTYLYHLDRSLSESHDRSTEIVTTRLLAADQCQMIAYECKSWAAFQAGECGYCDANNKQCFEADFNFQFENKHEPKPLMEAKTLPLFIATGKRRPFCLHHFQIKVRLANYSNKKPFECHLFKRKISLLLIDEQGDSSNITISNEVQPEVYTYLFLSERKPSSFRSGRVKMDQSLFKKSVSRNTKCRALSKGFDLEVNYMSSIDPVVRRRFSTHLCAVSSQNSDWMQLKEC